MFSATAALSATDLKALRSATMVAFDHCRDGDHRLRAIIEQRNGAFETRGEHKVAATSGIETYGSDYGRFNSAYALIQSAQFCDQWRTAVQSLRPGDFLSMEWRANSNGYVRDAGLNLDELVLHVYRGEQRKRVASYLLVVSVCPDNTARMIRP